MPDVILFWYQKDLNIWHFISHMNIMLQFKSVKRMFGQIWLRLVIDILKNRVFTNWIVKVCQMSNFNVLLILSSKNKDTIRKIEWRVLMNSEKWFYIIIVSEKYKTHFRMKQRADIVDTSVYCEFSNYRLQCTSHG